MRPGTYSKRLITTFLIAAGYFFLLGCADTRYPAQPVSERELAEEHVDTSCSYFYFLWGSNAEYKESYAEALEAYEKAAICDPKADYIAEKIPVLLIQLGRNEEATAWLENYILQRPEKTVQRFMLARLKIQEGKESEAIKLYEEALGIEPENNNIRLRLGLLYGKKGEFEVSERIFLDILRSDENSYFALLYLARLYTKKGQLTKAEDFYLKASKLNWSKDLLFEIAEFYNLRKQFQKAQEIYTEILCKDEKDERAALGMVQTYLFLQEGEAALQELSRIRDFSNSPERIDLVRSQILINIGEVERAKDILLDLLRENQFAQANYLLGVIYYEELDFNNAVQMLRRIPPNAPEFREAVILQVRILEETKKSEQSVALLKDAISSEDTRLPVFYSLLASVFQKQGKDMDALATLANGIEKYQTDESLLYEYAILLEKNMRHAKAMELMKRLLSFNPNHADALNFVGYSWADKNIRLDEAFNYIQKALELKPNSGYILDSLGWVYFRMGAYDKAKSELERAIELEPEDPYIYEHLGDTYKELKNIEKALYYYQKALELLTSEDKKRNIEHKIQELGN